MPMTKPTHPTSRRGLSRRQLLKATGGTAALLAAAKLKASGHACPFTTSWQSWTQLESFSTWHNTLFASKGNGFGGTDARLVFNGPLQGSFIPTGVNTYSAAADSLTYDAFLGAPRTYGATVRVKF